MTIAVTRALTATALALVAVAGLSACTSNSTGGDPKPTASATSSKVAETRYNDCIDGSLQVFDDSKDAKPVTFGDCAGASIISSSRTITLGTVATLTVEGEKNTIDVTGVKSLTVLGGGNTITYHGAAPKVVDEGKGNSIKPAS